MPILIEGKTKGFRMIDAEGHTQDTPSNDGENFRFLPPVDEDVAGGF